MFPKELNQDSPTENKPPSALTSPTNHQSHTTKPDEKELETRKERPVTKESKAPLPQNGEVVNKPGEVAKKAEVKSVETSSNHVAMESFKAEQSETPKQSLPLDKELVKGKVEASKGTSLNETKQPTTALPPSIDLKSTAPKPNIEEVKVVDVAEVRTARAKESSEGKEPKAQEKSPEINAKEIEAEVKKTEEVPSVKQGMRGVIRMTNFSSKPLQNNDTEDQVDTYKDDIKLLRKEEIVVKDTPNLKSALVGESSASSAPEKKTVTFAEPLNEGGEIKVLVNTTKDLGGKDGKREILAPPTLGIIFIFFS